MFWSSPVWNLGATWLLNYLLHSTILLGAIWLLARFRVLSPAFQDIFWKAALIGGIFTAGVHTLGMGGEPVGGQWRVSAPATEVPEFVVIEPNVFTEAPLAAGDAHFVFAEELSPPTDAGSLPHFLNRVRTGALQGWPQAMLVAWVLGGALCLARLLWLRGRLHRRLRSRTEVTQGPLADLFRSMRAAAGLEGRVRLSVSDRVGGPLAWGRSEIVLPRRALVDLTPEQQQNVLAHELAHLVRRDPSWRWYSALVEAVFFFQPLNRMARRGIHESAEYLCDDWAVRMTGQNLVMAKCLVEVAGWLRPLPAAAPVAGMAEQGSPLVRRVERLLRRDPASPGLSARWPILAALVLVAATAWFAPGFVPETPVSETTVFHGGAPFGHASNVWVQDPFADVSPDRGGPFNLPGVSAAPGRSGGVPSASPGITPTPEAFFPRRAAGFPAPPRVEPPSVPAPPAQHWEWKTVKRPVQLLTRVENVAVPDDVDRTLAVIVNHLDGESRQRLVEWQALLRENLRLQLLVSEMGMELQIQSMDTAAPVPEGKVVEIPNTVIRVDGLLEQVRELRQNQNELRRIREVLRRQVERTEDGRHVTFFVI